MKNCRISVFDPVREEKNLLEQYARRYDVRVDLFEGPLTESGAERICAGSAVSVNHTALVDARLIDCLRRRSVRYLCTRSVGTDHIDLAAAGRAGIHVEGVAYSPESVAEYTIMLMLMAARNAGSVLRRAAAGDFRLERRAGLELKGMTVGVVGTGRIGQAVISRLRGFGSAVLACDPHPHASGAVEYVRLGDLLARSDLVTLHLPLTSATRHLMSRERIACMRRGALLINAARGALVDTQALADALEGGRLGGAALDVAEGEEGWFYQDCSGRGKAPFDRLLRLPNAVLTPHTAFYTQNALDDMARNTILNCKQWEGGFRKWIS